MTGIVAIVLVLCMVAGLVTQLLMGYTKFDLRQYVIEFFVIDLLRFLPIIVLSMLVHTLVNNKYVAFFAVVAILIANAYMWTPLDVQSNLVHSNSHFALSYCFISK